MPRAKGKAKSKAKGKETSRARGKTSSGMEPNVAGLLCYVVGWLTGLIFFLTEKDNKFVRFHAMQSILVFGALSVVCLVLWIFTWIPYIWIFFLVINCIVGLFGLILWIFLMYKAYQGEKYKLPVAGNIAERQA
jgi:uncharacterized membrane protein